MEAIPRRSPQTVEALEWESSTCSGANPSKPEPPAPATRPRSWARGRPTSPGVRAGRGDGDGAKLRLALGKRIRGRGRVRRGYARPADHGASGAVSGAPRRKRFPDPRSARAGLRLGSEHARRRASGLSAFRLRGRRGAFRNRARGRGAAPADRGGPDSAMDRDRAIAAGLALGAASARTRNRVAWRIPRRAARIDDRSIGRRRRRRARRGARPSSRQAWRRARDRASVTSHRRRRSDAGPGAGPPHPAIARGGGCRDAGPGAGGHLRRVRRSARPYQSRDHGADGPRGATPSGDMDPATDRRDGGRGSRARSWGRPSRSTCTGLCNPSTRAARPGRSPASSRRWRGPRKPASRLRKSRRRSARSIGAKL